MNYAQFLEAILRIAYHKRDNSDQSGNPEGFKNTLETMFDDADLDLKKKAKNDDITAKMIDLSQGNFFEENYELLAALFSEKGMPRGDHHELSKPDFVGILKDTGLLIMPAKATKEESKK